MKTKSFFFAMLILMSLLTVVQCRKSTDELPQTVGNSELSSYNLTEQDLKAHQFRPAATDIQMQDTSSLKEDDVMATKKAVLTTLPPRLTSALAPAFDPTLFGTIVYNSLKDQVQGYSFQVFQGNVPIYSGQLNWAKSVADGNKAWTPDTRMHIASMSKLMTAIGLVKLLDKNNIKLDAHINTYIPSYWKRSAGFVANVTFRTLLNHTSGFSATDSRGDYAFMKEQVVKVPKAPSGFEYANANYSIMRILIAVIDGHIQSNATFGLPDSPMLDAAWDIITTQYFQTYMNKEVFAIAGLPTIGFSPAAGGVTAKAYASKANENGRDGDWSTNAGGIGFYMSVSQVLKTVNAFRNNLIVPSTAANPNRALYMLDNSLGNNGSLASPIGKVYFRKGEWLSGGKLEQTVLFCLPNNINIAVFVNSPTSYFTKDGYINGHISGLIYPAILASIH